MMCVICLFYIALDKYGILIALFLVNAVLCVKSTLVGRGYLANQTLSVTDVINKYD